MAKARTREPDPPTQLRGLKQELSKGLPRAVLMKGEEPYFRERGIDLAVAAGRDAGLELCRHDVSDPEFSLPRLLDDLGASPMFASARCIVVRSVDASRNGKSLLAKDGRKDSALVRAIASFVGGGREGCLVLGARTLRADHPVAKAVKAAGGVLVSCRKLWDSPPPWDPDPRKSELAQWAGQRASELGVRLSVDEATYVALATGNDLAAIDTQLEKVRRGGREQLRAIVGWSSGGTPWKAADELLSGQISKGLSAIEALFRAGFHSDRDGKTEVDPRAIGAILLGSLRNKARQGLIASRAVAQGAPFDQAAEEAGVNGKPAREALARELGLRTPRGWERIYGDVLELERKSRTGAEVTVDDFIPLALRWRSETPAQSHGGGRPQQQRRTSYR